MQDDLRYILNNNVRACARRLLGCLLIREIGGQLIIGKIVETEAYDQLDAASHSYHSQTVRNKVMFGEPGKLYVYFTYGMHCCANVVCGPEGWGAAVLIRAIEPIWGLNFMKEQRHNVGIKELTNGPAKLCQAFCINLEMNGLGLTDPPVMLYVSPPIKQADIQQTTRIGITKAKEKLLRFYIKNNNFVSRPL